MRGQFTKLKSESVTRYEYSNNYNGEFNGRELLAHSNTTGSQNGAPKRDFVLYKLLEPKERTHIGEEHQTADVKCSLLKEMILGQSTIKTLLLMMVVSLIINLVLLQ